MVFLGLAILLIALYPPSRIEGTLYYFVIGLGCTFFWNSARIIRYVLSLFGIVAIFAFTPAFFAVVTGSPDLVGTELLFGTGIALKSFAIVTFVVGVGGTLTASGIFRSLRWFKMPEQFIFLLLVAYRYLHLFKDEVQSLVEARQLRLAGRSHLKGITGAIRLLLFRAFGHAESVYIAMRLRGGESSFPLLMPVESTSSDTVLLLTSAIIVGLPYTIIFPVFG